MKTGIRKLIWLCSAMLVILFGCNERNNTTDTDYAKWFGKEIVYPERMTFLMDLKDTIPLESSAKLTVVSYNDSIGCMDCNLRLSKWNGLIKDINDLTHSEVRFVFFINVNDHIMLKHIIYANQFHIPICINAAGQFCERNNLPLKSEFRCFLLDSANRIILIGNPVQNSKIKDLYIRTICERLGINNDPKTEDNPRVNFGTFTKEESKTAQFIIKNTDNDFMKIDSVYTSCECTTATIDKTGINKNESALLSITYTPDGVGEFYREVYVKISGEEKPRVFAIEGKTE